MATTTAAAKVKGSTVPSKAGGKLMGKDYVLIAVFAVLLFVCFCAFAMVFSMSASTAWFTHSIGAIPAGIVWMYLFARVPKCGAIAMASVVVAALALLMGMLWTGPVGIVVGGVLAELVAGAGSKRTTARLIAAFAVFTVCFWVGQTSLIFLAGQSYVDLVVSYGMTAEYGQQLVDFIHGPLALVAVAATAAGSCLGGLFGAKLFKKHFAKIAA